MPVRSVESLTELEDEKEEEEEEGEERNLFTYRKSEYLIEMRKIFSQFLPHIDLINMKKAIKKKNETHAYKNAVPYSMHTTLICTVIRDADRFYSLSNSRLVVSQLKCVCALTNIS